MLDINETESAALKQLCEIYARRGDTEKGTKYLESMLSITKKNDNQKYREAVIKLMDLYEKDLNMEKIDVIFKEYCEVEDNIGEDFVRVARAYFQVGTANQCFKLQDFELMGAKGETIRTIVPAAK